MNSVVAISKNNVWAAGEGNFAAALEQWNGKIWSYVPAYTYGSLTVLNSISARDRMTFGQWASTGIPIRLLSPSTGTARPGQTNRRSSLRSQPTQRRYRYLADRCLGGWIRGRDLSESSSTDVNRTLERLGMECCRSPNKDPKGSQILTNQLYAVTARSATDVWAVGNWTVVYGRWYSAKPIPSLERQQVANRTRAAIARIG